MGDIMIKLSPSILAADFANLEREIKTVSDADYIHLDVMDGHFVPNITIGIPVVAAIRKITSLPLDVHLMIDRPLRYIERFVKAGADLLTIHLEADSAENTLEALKLIRSLGCRASLCLKPATPASAAAPFLPFCDMILVMTVEPGFGGQTFMHDQLPKIKALSDMIRDGGYQCDIEVDGGIDTTTAPLVISHGANVLVSGSTIFHAQDRAAVIETLRKCE